MGDGDCGGFIHKRRGMERTVSPRKQGGSAKMPGPEAGAVGGHVQPGRQSGHTTNSHRVQPRGAASATAGDWVLDLDEARDRSGRN